MTMPAVAGLLLTSYLIGATPFGYLIARWRGVDILRLGSGNIGATNVGRVLGRRFGILVFLFDFAKGALPVAATTAFAERGNDGLRVAAGLSAFLGHLFPVYLRFRGGKGVATAAGVVAVLFPGPALGALLIWVAVVCATRYVSLASLTASAALCVLHLWLTPDPFAPDNRLLTLFCFPAAGLILVRHHANVHRLLHGTENRLQETPTMFHLNKSLHVLALGLWFGMAVFFTFVVGLSLFGTFWSLGEKETGERPIWFPLAKEFDRDPNAWKEADSQAKGSAEENLPFKDKKEVRREQGSRAAGMAISPLFDTYFFLQGICGFLAVATALNWSWAEPRRTVHRVRTTVLLLALATVVIGWPLERKVSDSRLVRNEAVDAVLQSEQPTPEQLRTAASSIKDFARWHLYSLFLNFGTVALVAIAMALAACLPSTVSSQQKPASGPEMQAGSRQPLTPSAANG